MNKLHTSVVIVLLFIAGLSYLLMKEDSKIFTSERLGISFDYSSDKRESENNEVAVFEQNNRVYIYLPYLNESFDPEDTTEQFVEVFYKEPSESMEEAIKKTVLKDYPFSGCTLEKIELDSATAKESLEYYNISYPSISNEVADLDEMLADAEKCNPQYSTTNAIRYFVYDPNFPERFFFFNLGQDPIMIDDGRMWANTFVILPLEWKF